jgi:hypothetical protein
MTASIKEALGKAVKFVARAFTEKGEPSSSRLLAGWLTVSSMALIWFMVRHMMTLPVDKLQVWVGGLPLIIGALATFAVSPYGVNRLSGMFKKDDAPDAPKPEGEDK